MKKTRLAIAAALALSCAACTTAPPIVNYYTLDMEPSGAAGPEVNIEVAERLRALEPLSKRNILIKASPVEVEYYAVDEWVASVDELVREKLEAEFGPYVEGRDAYVLDGTILAFQHEERPDGDMAHVKMRVSVQDPSADRDAPPLLRKTYEERRPVEEPTRRALVRGLSEGVARIAAQIVNDVEQAATH